MCCCFFSPLFFLIHDWCSTPLSLIITHSTHSTVFYVCISRRVVKEKCSPLLLTLCWCQVSCIHTIQEWDSRDVSSGSIIGAAPGLHLPNNLQHRVMIGCKEQQEKTHGRNANSYDHESWQLQPSWDWFKLSKRAAICSERSGFCEEEDQTLPSRLCLSETNQRNLIREFTVISSLPHHSSNSIKYSMLPDANVAVCLSSSHKFIIAMHSSACILFYNEHTWLMSLYKRLHFKFMCSCRESLGNP